jgi:hypothetical protein
MYLALSTCHCLNLNPKLNPTNRYLLVGYGGRDMRPATAERLRRGLELYHFAYKVKETLVKET